MRAALLASTLWMRTGVTQPPTSPDAESKEGSSSPRPAAASHSSSSGLISLRPPQ